MSAVDTKPVETAPPAAAETKKSTAEEQIKNVKDTLSKKGVLEKLKGLLKKFGQKKAAAPAAPKEEAAAAPAEEPTPAPAPAAAA